MRWKRRSKPPAPQRKSDIGEIEMAFILSVMFDMGIVPIDDVTKDMSRVLSQVNPEEAREKKRKFRKLWRKASAGLQRKNADRHMMGSTKACLGRGKHKPSRKNMLERKRIVFENVWYTRILPILSIFYETQDTSTRDVP